jgi:PAS domain S-box-containing protein
MADAKKSNGQLMIELEELRTRVADLEARHDESSRVEDALRASEEQYRSLVENIPGAVFRSELTAPWRVFHMSEGILPLTGHSPKAFLDEGGLDFGDLILPDDLAEVDRIVARGVDGHRSYEAEYHIRHADGSVRFVHERGRATYSDAGEPLWLDGVIVDATERRRAEEEVRALAGFPSENPNPVLRFGEDGTIMYANEASRPLLADWGRDVGQVLDGKWRGLVKEALRAGRGRRAELELGGRVLALTIAPVSDAGYVNVYGLDVTDRKRAEEERLNLERHVQHAQKLESLGVLAGGIAHDFNNLLMIVLGNVDLALEDLSEVSPARPCLEEIDRAARKAADLTRQMLAYSGKGRFVVRPVDLTEVIEEMRHLLETSLPKKVSLRLDLVQRLPLAEADVAQMQQVIVNLITNAAEAYGENTGTVVVSSGTVECDRGYLDRTVADAKAEPREELPEGRYVYIDVADEGCGMDLEVRTRLFEPFFTTKFAGRGLGMAAVAGIVRSHSGGILVESEPGIGTTVRLLVPAFAARESVKGAVQGDGAGPDGWRGSGTVLVVDDESPVRVLAGRILSRAGFDVTEASDGHEAVEIFRKRAGDIVCVLLDMSMPRMSGEETFRELRRIREDVKVILCSGFAEQEVTQNFAEPGLAGFIQKPYRIGDLKAKLRGILAG